MGAAQDIARGVTQRTPGPWLVLYDVPNTLPGLARTEADVERLRDEAERWSDGNVSPIFVDMSAALAAPDLLAACEAIAEDWCAEWCSHDASGAVRQHGTRCARLSAAIAKGRGGA